MRISDWSSDVCSSALPDVDRRLHASDDTVGVGASGVDIAIRYGRGPYPGLTSTPLIADQFAPVVNPGLRLRSPEQLRRVPLIHFEWRHTDPDHPTWSSWFQAAGIADIDPISVRRFTNDHHAIPRSEERRVGKECVHTYKSSR